MLDSIWIENFKSYKTGQSLPLAPITLLIGANASGKSNAIEAFRFLSWFAGGEKLSTIKNRINDSEKIFRGDVKDIFAKDENTLSLGASLSVDFLSYFENWKFIIGIDKSANLRVKDENLTLRHTKNSFFYLKEYDYESFDMKELKNKSYYLNNLILKNKLIIPNFKDESGISFNQAIYDIDSDSSALKIASTILEEQLKPYLSKENSLFLHASLLNTALLLARLNISYFIQFYDFIPSKMRNESLDYESLGINGQNLSGVLYRLWEDPEQDYKSDILRFICSLPEQDFKSLKFYHDHRDRVELALIESFGGTEQEWGIELLSDGTLRVLGMAAAILSSPEDSTLVIEEIDNGIHPSRAKYLLETMLYFAEKKNLKLLISTHNPALMDALPDKALGDVVFAYRDPKIGDSRLIRLSDLDDYVGLVSQGPLGELVTQGIVDRFVKNPISKEEKKKKALSWLNEMRGESNE